VRIDEIDEMAMARDKTFPNFALPPDTWIASRGLRSGFSHVYDDVVLLRFRRSFNRIGWDSCTVYFAQWNACSCLEYYAGIINLTCTYTLRV
jgi:hypothetical protein